MAYPPASPLWSFGEARPARRVSKIGNVREVGRRHCERSEEELTDLSIKICSEASISAKPHVVCSAICQLFFRNTKLSIYSSVSCFFPPTILINAESTADENCDIWISIFL